MYIYIYIYITPTFNIKSIFLPKTIKIWPQNGQFSTENA